MRQRRINWDYLLACIGLVLLGADVVLFFFLVIDLFHIGTGNLPWHVAPLDELFVLMLCTAHFPSNTTSLVEYIGRLFRRNSQKPEDRDLEESNCSPTWFFVSLFASLYDATGVVRTNIAPYSKLLSAAEILAVSSSLATAVWAGVTVIRFYILFVKKQKELVIREKYQKKHRIYSDEEDI
jgi:hypothetical protein